MTPGAAMKSKAEFVASKTHEANIEVHTRMADTYEASEPHFREENQQKVRGRLAELRQRVGGGRLLDVGCGTGFIIHLATPLFDEIHGVDITPAMYGKVKVALGNIQLHEASAEKLPFQDSTFDAASAYSFMDHVADQGQVLKEVARTLKPGGIFYVDLVPNRLFWAALSAIPASAQSGLSDIVAREHSMIKENDKKVEREYGIKAELFRSAEPGKLEGGIDPTAFQRLAIANGFSACEITFDWFLGQGSVMHGASPADAATVEIYLRRAAPVSNPLFKYLCFHCIK